MRPRLQLFIVSVLASVLLSGGTVLYLLDDTRASVDSHLRRLNALTALMLECVAAERHFSAQMDAWNKLLLRGHEPNDFEKYRVRFENEERLVQAALHQVQGRVDVLGPDAAAVERLIADHAALGQIYRVALIAYDPSAPTAARSVDERVRSIERATDDGIARLTLRTEAATRQQLERELIGDTARFTSLRTLLLVGAGPGMLIAIAIALLGVRRRAGGPPGTTAHDLAAPARQ